jgi:type I restriction enzyme S subunit
MREWKRCALGDVVELKRGYDLPTRDRVSGSYPIISSSGPSGFHSEAKVRAPGVVTGRYGTIGEVYFVEQDFWPLNTALYVRDFKGNDPRFVSYFLQALDFNAYSDKAAVPGLNRNHLHQAEVILPPVPAQSEIAGVLGALDDRIEQNRRTARALERLARAIFRAWFVDFEPVKAKAAGAASFPSMPQRVFDALPIRFVDSDIGPVPEGWEVKDLETIATFLNGLPLQKYPPRGDGGDLPVIKIAQLRKGSTQGAALANGDVADQYVINDRDLLFSWSGTLEAEFWFGGKGALNQHLFKVTSSHFPSWLCLLWIRQHLTWFRAIAASKATTMGHIKRGHLGEAKVAVPPGSVLRAADAAIGSLYDLYAQAMVEARKLAEMRDYLLPKLLSGEVRVTDAERLIGTST